MIGDKSQTQTAGDSCVNIQAQHLHIAGISAGEARQIALDVYKANFAALSQEAISTALSRAEKLSDDLIAKLSELDEKLLSQFRTPSMQLAVLGAQREYARTGDETVEQLLVSLLVDRARENKRNLRQIALEEAITVIPKLTEKQVDILTLNTLVNDHYFVARSLPALKDYLSTVARFKAMIRFMSPDIRHLEFAGCAKLTSPTRIKSLDAKLKESFPGLFPKGFTREAFAAAVPQSERFESLLVQMESTDLVRLNAISAEDINSFFQAHGIGNEEKKFLFDLLRSTSMDFKEVQQILIEMEPSLDFLFSFDNRDIFNLELTPVGVAIATANFARKIGHPLGWPYSMREV